MKPIIILLLIMTITVTACTDKNSHPERWTDDEINSWFEKKDWFGGWNVSPDNSINKRTLAILYHENQKHWDQAFNFLKSANLKNLPLGKQELEGEHVFVTVQQYFGKEKPDALYESHKKYIDIQYVIDGEELIGLTTIDKVKVKEPYNEEKDISFYDFDGGDYLKATPEKFFIFFPEDVHRPSITAGDSIQIKKIVVKILLEK
ncbi:MAG TPA: YhcH/YjgK/YiaL family protein [Draconibacterium sp.]|nr:YhcH/YjgK/YiaL family protein [Draconibacterium sp.]